MRLSNLFKLSMTAFFVVSLFGCQLASESDEATTVVLENDETTLEERVYITSDTVVIESDSSNKAKRNKAGFASKSKKDKEAEITLTLVAEVDPLEYEGTKLQATEIRIHGSKAYVSYNTAGEVFLGGVEVFDISDADEPVLISSVVFTDTDVNGLAVKGSDLYLAAATSAEGYDSPAILRVIKLAGGKLSDDISNKDIVSYAATDVEVYGSDVYVTSGADDGYTTILDQTSLEVSNSIAMDDARSIDSDNGDIAVIAGSNGVDGVSAQLMTFDKTTGELQNSYDLDGASIKHAKSTIEVKKDKAILAMGNGGTQLVCLATGEVLKTIDLPVVAGLDASLTVANAATAYKRSVFMGNGEAGVYLAVDDENIDSKGCDASTLEVIGKLELDLTADGLTQSVNHIVYRNDVLFVAAGLGGLKVLKVEDSEATEDDDDSDDDGDDD